MCIYIIIFVYEDIKMVKSIFKYSNNYIQM